MDSCVGRLTGVVQNYSWGVTGDKSMVAAAYKANSANASVVIDPEAKYAELWFGSHRNGESLVHSTESNGGGVQSLSAWTEEPTPYLFKLLSIAKPLSLQLHPDLASAQTLHASSPNVFPDSNDKPEMVIAVSEWFEALCGFRRLKEIACFAQTIPSFGELFKIDDGTMMPFNDEEEVLKHMLAKLFALEQSQVVTLVDAVLEMDVDKTDAVVKKDIYPIEVVLKGIRSVKSMFKDEVSLTDQVRTGLQVFRILHAAHAYDRAVFSVFFLNYVKIKAGTSMFTPHRTLHSYIAGDCFEVMKCSDNVLRAGLTPKQTNIEQILSLVEYKSMVPSNLFVKPLDIICKIDQSKNSSLKVFIPPQTDAFRVYWLKLTAGASLKDMRLPAWSPITAFCARGTCQIGFTNLVDEHDLKVIDIKPGQAWMCKREAVVSVNNLSDLQTNLTNAQLVMMSESNFSDTLSAQGDAVLLFVLPNAEPDILKRPLKGNAAAKNVKCTDLKSPQPEANECVKETSVTSASDFRPLAEENSSAPVSQDAAVTEAMNKQPAATTSPAVEQSSSAQEDCKVEPVIEIPQSTPAKWGVGKTDGSKSGQFGSAAVPVAQPAVSPTSMTDLKQETQVKKIPQADNETSKSIST